MTQSMQNSPRSFQLWGNNNFTVIVQKMEDELESGMKSAVEKALVTYLNFILKHKNSIPLEYILTQEEALQFETVPLPAVFTELDVVSAGSEQPSILPAVRAVAENRHIVVVGDPGSGKTTLVNYLSVLMASRVKQDGNEDDIEDAEEILSKDSLKSWNDGLYFPIHVTLKYFANSESFFSSEGTGDYSDLVSFIGREIVKNNSYIQHSIQNFVLPEMLENGKALVVLDGLDELPLPQKLDEIVHASRKDRSNVRLRLKNILNSFVKMYPGCRIVVTSRSYAYRPESEWRLDERYFATATLRPFSDTQICDYVRYWYKQIAKRARKNQDRNRTFSEKQINSLVKLFWETLQNDEYMLRLASTPLILTFIVSQFDPKNSTMPSLSRTELYQRIVTMLTARWSQYHNNDQDTLRKSLGLATDSQLEQLLSIVAFEAHCRTEQLGWIDNNIFITQETLEKAWQKFRRGYKVNDIDKETWRRLKERTGILMPYLTDDNTDQEIFVFPHPSLQEWLAATALMKASEDTLPLTYWPEQYRSDTRNLDFAGLIEGLIEASHERWREVIMLALEGKFDSGNKIQCWNVIARLTTGALPNHPLDSRWYGVLICARLIHRYRDIARVDELQEAQQTIDWLLAALEYQAMSFEDRDEIGNLLADLGDPRVSIYFDDERIWSLEEVENKQNFWVEIPETSILLGNPLQDPSDRIEEKRTNNQTKDVSSFFVSRYQVTNQLFDLFLEDGRYNQKYWNWSEASKNWFLDEQNTPILLDSTHALGLKNAPRVYVSWYEAMAFCKWLTDMLSGYGLEISIMGESQWISAATGGIDSIYLYGDEFIPFRENTDICNLKRTCSVGIFAPNRNGLYDMGGNVAEWTRTIWRQDVSRPESNEISGKVNRTVRGSHYDDFDPRVGKRRNVSPQSRYKWLGFRLVATKISK